MFEKFSKAVHAQYVEMSKHELYVVDAPNLFEGYLHAWPEGTNPMFRKRTEHDCSCCKQFIRTLGRVVGIMDGKIVTVWDDHDVPEPYRTVTGKMGKIVRGLPIQTVFRTKERKYGVEHNYDKATNERWNHFHGEVADRHHHAMPDTKRGEREAIHQVLTRGLTEFRTTDVEAVLDLIDSNGLYKGADFRAAIVGFQGLMQKFRKLTVTGPGRSIFTWSNLDNPHAKFRNTVIGNLFVELAKGTEFDAAVRMYEAQVAPANYKRPTSVITQAMVEKAVQTLTDLGLGGAIYRRFANIKDVSVNDVLFVDNEVRSQMKDGVAALLESSVKKATVDTKKAIPVTADVFLKNILPGAKSLELFLENKHTANFVSLTGGDGGSRLFKWNNDFAWSYIGDMADSELRRRVQALGGRVDGVLRFSHRWNYDRRNASLMDLHVFMPGSSEHKDGCHNTYPSGQRVGWNCRNDSKSKGVQDVDYTDAAPEGYIPVENITFPSMNLLREGKYVFKIHNWTLRNPTQGGFQAEIEFGGQVFQYEMVKPLKHHEWVTVATATLKNGVFTIEHKLDSSSAIQEKWGVETEGLVPVSAVMFSPNHWGDQKVGARHLIFSLKGCHNPEPTRGIYNEFLRGDLEQHRKVFEVLGSKTKCKPTPDQVSGVGFTNGRNDSVTVVVDGRRSYTLGF